MPAQAQVLIARRLHWNLRARNVAAVHARCVGCSDVEYMLSGVCPCLVHAAGSAGAGSGADIAGRKPPLFISLSAIRAARKSAAALLAADATLVDSVVKPKPKPKPQAAVPAAAAPPSQHETGSGTKSK